MSAMTMVAMELVPLSADFQDRRKRSVDTLIELWICSVDRGVFRPCLPAGRLARTFERIGQFRTCERFGDYDSRVCLAHVGGKSACLRGYHRKTIDDGLEDHRPGCFGPRGM